MYSWEMDRVIDQFADKDCGKGASAQELAEFEGRFGVTLPESYKDFLRRYGWARFSHQEIYGLGPDVPAHLQLTRNTHSERFDMAPRLPPSLVPIMNDGAGNHYSLRTDQSVNGECPVVLWNHELGPEQELAPVSSTFRQWLLALLDTLKTSSDS